MGEYLQRDPSDKAYVPEGGGMSADAAKAFQALASVVAPPVAAGVVDPKIAMAKVLAQQSGKTYEEALAFLGGPTPAAQLTAKAAAPRKAKAKPAPVETAEQEEIIEEVIEEVIEAPKVRKPRKVKAAPAPVITKNETTGQEEVITQTLDDEEASDETLALLNEEEFEVYDGKIRVGSKIVVTYDPPIGGRINWKGRKGIVTRIIGNEKAKVYEVEFPKGKFPFTRRNKTTGKIEKGFTIKKIRNTFDSENIELAIQ